MTTRNSNHIDVRRHFLRERVAIGEFEVVHVSILLRHADCSHQASAHVGVSFSPQLCDKFVVISSCIDYYALLFFPGTGVLCD